MNKIHYQRNQGPRENLEDAVFAVGLPCAGPGDTNATILIVCDGVGGHACGEVASELAVSMISAELVAYFAAAKARGNGEDLAPDAIMHLLGETLTRANVAILEEASDDPDRKGMATTVVCAVVIGNTLHIAWAGDSRLYIYNSDGLAQVTHDHSESQRLVDIGLLDPKEADSHPLAHTITRYLGQKTFSPDTRIARLNRGDYVIIATDGLTDVVDDDLLEAHIDGCRVGAIPVHDSPGYLIDAALSLNTGDNVTVLVYEHALGATATTFTGGYADVVAGTLLHLRTMENLR